MPWGHIAGKWYGAQNVRPILMVHGWQDNAGSFDTLIPHLPKNLSYLAIDLPGHGFSSHFPKGCNYHSVDYIPLLERIRQYYQWDQLSIVAHSMGSIVSFIYASLFPKNVNLVCALDTLKMQCLPPERVAQIYSYQTMKLITLNEDLKTPEYTYEDLIQRVYEGSKKSIPPENAKYLIKRGTKPSLDDPNKFYFTRDIRVKFMQFLYAEQKIGFEYMKRIESPYLFIRGEDQFFSESEKNINEAADVFRKYNKTFDMIRVKGTHHFHLNEPELISGKICDFLTKYHIGQEMQTSHAEINN